jgi:hypothetical protein
LGVAELLRMTAAWFCRKICAISPRTPKLMFWGRSPVRFCTASASSLEVTMPITCPPWSRIGPPLLPLWIGAEIWKREVSPRSPPVALT